MAAGVQTESAQRTSATVTELLRKQPFFGSLALRLPLRADPSRETLASDGHEIRYSPRWIADTDAHVIETAMARVVMACALKHHTRRGERDPERWQQASQLVTHALVRDAGFTLPPEAEAWDGLSVEQAYNRLPEPEDGDPGNDHNAPSGGGSDAGTAAPSSPGDDDGESDSSSDFPDDGGDEDGDAQDGDGQGDGSDTPASHDPSGTGEIMDAGARAGGNGRGGRVAGGCHRRGAGVGRGHAPGPQSRQGRGQGAGRGRGDGEGRARQHAGLACAAAPLHDRRRAPRL